MRNGPLEMALLVLIALAGCRGEEAGDSAAGPAASGGSGKAVQTATLTGLYESGEGPRRNQLCMIEREERGTTFGFVIWGSGEKSCSGSGPATREGNRLVLRLDGDESCALSAETDGRRVSLPATVTSECQRYYCGDGAQIGGATFVKVAGEEADALRAADLVGDRLCGG